MREWVTTLEHMVDQKLSLWKKGSNIEDGGVVQLNWQFEQNHMMIDVFWRDKEETVRLQCISPRAKHIFVWNHLGESTFNRVADRVGNLSMAIMYPKDE